MRQGIAEWHSFSRHGIVSGGPGVRARGSVRQARIGDERTPWKSLLVSLFASSGILATLSCCVAQADNVLRDINRRRPAIAMFLYNGHPALYAQRRAGRSDAERILSYFDPVIGSDWASYASGPGCKGAPDLDEYVHRLSDHLDWLKSINAYGLLHTQGLVTCGHRAFPESWLPDGALRDEYDDRPVGSAQPGRLALANPRLYTEVMSPTIERYLGGVRDMSRAALLWCESEPGAWDDYETLRTTGNRHTIALFQAYLRDLYRNDIALLNQAAAARYRDFSEIRPSDDNWLVRIKVAHFGSYLLYAFYQGRTVDKYHETFPQIPVGTRWCELVGGVATDPRDCSRFDTVRTDYLGLTWYPGNAFIPYSKNRSLMGKVTSNGSFLCHYGRPLAWGETAMWRDDQTPENQPYVRPFQPFELTNLIYRSLYYNLGLLMIFNWSFPNGNPTWISHADSQEALRAARATINELDRIAPYATFGVRRPPPAGLIITRDAACFPVAKEINANTFYYNDVVHGASAVMEDPRASHIDLMEEHAGLSLEKLSGYRGLIVYDACLSASTRAHLRTLAERGHKLLVIGAPRYLDPLYLPAPLPAVYPVQETAEGSREVLAKTSHHPLFNGLPTLRLLGAAAVTLRPPARACVTDATGQVFGAANDTVVYLSGVPMDINQRRTLYINFIRWCGEEPVDLYLSRWEHALIAQNFKSACTDISVDGHIRRPFPWYGHLLTPWTGAKRPQVWEDRGDFPWLAFEDTPRGRLLQGVFLDSGEIRVFKEEPGECTPHFEGVSNSLGFRHFVLAHSVLRATATVAVAGRQILRLARGFWPDAPLRWFVYNMDHRVVTAKGDGTQIRFTAKPGTTYVVEVQRKD